MTFNMITGREVGTADTCGDSADVFLDEKRNRICVSCGAGALDVFERGPKDLNLVPRIETARGARTSCCNDLGISTYLVARSRKVASMEKRIDATRCTRVRSVVRRRASRFRRQGAPVLVYRPAP